jgi:hypothetical protein
VHVKRNRRSGGVCSNATQSCLLKSRNSPEAEEKSCGDYEIFKIEEKLKCPERYFLIFSKANMS